MSRIQILPENLCNKIAAGEIVERPASVVKELIENAIDAGSARITVETEESGRRLIRVTDDGEGMGADDAVRAIERHATSKIRSESDLSDIRTMGFRGEALPSIASVSRMRLVTSEKGALVGIEVRVSPAGQAQTRETAPMSGTLVEAADLFYNTPARQKFLRSNSTELSHIVHAVQQQALAHPWIHFRLTHNGGELLDYPAVSDEMERAAQVIGTAASRGNGPDLIEIRAEAGPMRLLGLVSKPGVFRATREKQEFFLNRRPIKNTTLSHALSEAYGTLLGKGRHPAAFLFLEVNPDEADVNVHPAKREVRFRDTQAIHQFVRNAIRARLIRENGASGFEESSAGEAAWGGGSGRPSGIVTSDAPGRHAVSSASYSREAMEAYRPLRAVPSANPFPERFTDAPGPPLFSTRVQPLGQVDQTYIVALVGSGPESELHLIDQHAAHERLLYERLLSQQRISQITIQPLLIPEVVEFPAADALVFREVLSSLVRIGMEVEEFGERSFQIRALPALLGAVDGRALLTDLLDDLRDGAGPSHDALLLNLTASMACHAAIKAHQPLQIEQTARLLQDLYREEVPPTCPHGRPIRVRFGMADLERLFQRR